VGWEGDLLALNGLFESPFQSLTVTSLILSKIKTRFAVNAKLFHTNKKIPSIMRIGPHNFDVIQVLIGSLLGDGHLEKRGERVRAKFEQTSRNVEYLTWFHMFFASRGYCSETVLKLFKQIKKKNFVYHGYKFSTFSFSSLTWLHDAFYIDHVKHLPLTLLEEMLTPMALAIWFMNDGSLLGKGYKIATSCFEKQELEGLCILLYKKYGLECSLHKDRKYFSIYIKSTSAKSFSQLVLPYMIDSMKYKFTAARRQ
jgi:ubiquinol-cytochrome c reductase cytochrome b subunit